MSYPTNSRKIAGPKSPFSSPCPSPPLVFSFPFVTCRVGLSGYFAIKTGFFGVLLLCVASLANLRWRSECLEQGVPFQISPKVAIFAR